MRGDRVGQPAKAAITVLLSGTVSLSGAAPVWANVRYVTLDADVVVTAPRVVTNAPVDESAAASVGGVVIEADAVAQAPQTAGPRLNTTNRDVMLVVPVRDVGPLGQVEVRITPQDRVFVSVADLVSALSRSASPMVVSTLRNKAGADGFASLAALNDLGLKLDFDPASLELVLGLDAEARLRRTIPLGFEGVNEPVEKDASSPFAVALSYQGSLDYEHRGPDKGLDSPRFSLDLDGRLRVIAFENRFSYDGNEDQVFKRQASRLIYDQPGRSLRWTAGDQIATGASFQNTVDISGLGLSRLRQTYEAGRSLAAKTSRSLTLRSAATVEIYVNGLPTRTIQLDAGTYDLTDLPMTAGANDVQIVVQDQAGDRQVIDFDFFSDADLLAPGISEFDFQAGIRAPFANGKRDYQSSQAVATGYYRRGITNRFTGGVNFQLAERAQQAGVQSSFSALSGLFDMDLAASNGRDFGSGYAARLQYRYVKDAPQVRGSRRFDASLEHRSENFGGIEDFPQANRFSWIGSARYSQPLNQTVTLSVGGDYSRSRTTVDEDRYGGSVGLNWQAGPLTSISARVSYQNDSIAGRSNVAVGLTAFRRFGLGTYATASAESADERYRVGFTHAPRSPLDSFGYTAQLLRQRGVTGLDGVVNYNSNRGDIALAHQTTFDEGGALLAQTTSTRVSGSIAYAGGKVAIGRRVNTAFAIVDTHETLGSDHVVIGGRESDQRQAQSGWFGPALVSLGAYSRQTLIYDVPEAPAGYDLGEGLFRLYPWLHSGFAMTVGSAYNVTASGILLDAYGEPLTLKSGVARSLTDPAASPVGLFTNRTGRFGVSGLSAGTWRLSFIDGVIYEFTIKGSQGALVDTGVLRPISGSPKP